MPGSINASLAALRKLGYAPGILQKVASDAGTGIIGDPRDLRRRTSFFGGNNKPLPEIKRLGAMIKE